MKKRYFTFLFLITIVTLFSTTIEKTYNFYRPEIYQDKGYDRIELHDLNVITQPGFPELPSQQIKLLLPPGEAVQSVNIVPGNRLEVKGEVNLFPIQQPYPMSYEGEITFTDQDPEIYLSEEKYPASIIEHQNTNYYRGYSILLATLTPFEYDPLTRKLFYFAQVTLEVETVSTPVAEAAFNKFYKATPKSREIVAGMVQNPDLNARYPDLAQTRDDIVDLFIITSSTYSDVFDDFVSFKKGQGYITEIKLTDNIYTEYSGIDNADKIRNFIIDAYENNSTEYIILGGDTEIIPHRGFYLAAGSTIDEDLPSDLYYSGLDRVGTGSGPDWNTDNDSYWGETNEADYFAEVMIGRISADTRPEFAAALNKQIMYQDSPVIADLEKAIMVGESLDSQTWGATCKDEIINGGTYNGFSTVGFPANFTIQTQYERTSSWSWTDLRDKFNNGVNLVNHLGHSSTTYNMKFYTSYVTDTNLTSDGSNHNFYIIYSQGCYPAAFDNRNSSGSYGDDVIVEEFTTIDNGCVAFLGNTRYGWYNPGGTNSSSQYLDRQFFDAIFGENIYQIAAMNEDSRADGASQCNGDPWFRWAYYEITLFGDPSLDIWTDSPSALSATYDSGVQMGESQIEFFTDAPGARIGLLQDGELIGRGIADGSGDLQLDLFSSIDSDSEIEVSIIAHNKTRHTGTIVVVSNEPFILYNSNEIDDSSGNVNGFVDYAETIDLTVELRNAGNQPASNVNAVLTTGETNITITDGTEYYGLMEAFDLKEISDGFQFTAIDGIEDQTEVLFDLEITGDGRTTWFSDFNITVNAPALEIASWTIDDSATGNNNGRLDAGENVDIIVSVENSGHSLSPVVLADLTCPDSEITINTSSISLGTLAADQTVNSTFNISVDNDVTTGTPVQFQLSLDAGNYSENGAVTLAVGLIADDFENGSFSSFNWQFSDDADWFVTTSSPYEGDYCTQSGDIDDYGISSLILEADVLAAGNISFYRRVSSENNYDYLRFYIDDVVQDQWCGEESWAEVSFPVSVGNHTFKWSFEKDLSLSSGSDCGWIDYIIFPAIGMPGLPDIAIGDQSFDVELEAGETTERSLRVENNGNGMLNYSISLEFQERADGGPDTFGYFWTDSDNVSGPEYNWIDISGSSTEVVFTHNDQSSSLIPIGFEFPFYGEEYTELRINPNGWVGFGEDWTDYHNYEIPRTDAPRPAIFGVWDDLDPLQGGNVFYSGNEERFIIWFDNVIHYPGYYNGTYDFEIVLYPSGDILLQYRSLSGDLNTCSIGMQNNTGTDGLQIAYNESYLHNELSIEIKKPRTWLQVTPLSSSIIEGSWEDVEILISAIDMIEGDHSCDIQIASNDPDENLIVVPFNLTVVNGNISIPNNVRISQNGSNMELNWDAVSGALAYKIYISDSPTSGFSLYETTSSTNWIIPFNTDRKFFRVSAVN